VRHRAHHEEPSAGEVQQAESAAGQGSLTGILPGASRLEPLGHVRPTPWHRFDDCGRTGPLCCGRWIGRGHSRARAGDRASAQPVDRVWGVRVGVGCGTPARLCAESWSSRVARPCAEGGRASPSAVIGQVRCAWSFPDPPPHNRLKFSC
jgi:hypothetical protein